MQKNLVLMRHIKNEKKFIVKNQNLISIFKAVDKYPGSKTLKNQKIIVLLS